MVDDAILYVILKERDCMDLMIDADLKKAIIALIFILIIIGFHIADMAMKVGDSDEEGSDNNSNEQ